MSTSKVAILFAIGSALFWMFGSIVQCEALNAVGRHDFGSGSIIATVIGVVPLVLYALICLAVFRRLERNVRAAVNSTSRDLES